MVDYVGDAARLYYGQKLLTDNWFSGYGNPGNMQIGLSYLAAEYGFPLGTGGTESFLLEVLPLTQHALQTVVYLDSDYWPAFDGQGVALGINSIIVDVVYYANFTAN